MNLTVAKTSANGPDLNYDYQQSHGINFEVVKPLRFNENWSGVGKLLLFHNQAPMGNYALANANFTGIPDLSSTHQGLRTKDGFSFNAELSYRDLIGFFSRYSWNDGKNETWAFTEIDEAVSFGMHIWGKNWNRSKDYVGLAWVRNGLSKSHQQFQALGGNGFMIGDGNLNYGGEHILEMFYQLSIPGNQFFISPDYQLVVNPGYNKDRGPVHVFSLRVHTEF